MRPVAAALPWALAAAALVLSGLFAQVLAPRWQAQALALEAAAAQAAPVKLARVDPAAALPDAAQHAARTATLLELARREGLQLLSVEQRMLDGPSVQRQELTLLARARYAGLRGFVQSALAADPALALDVLRLAHDDAAPGLLQARLHFSLLQRAREGS